YPDAADYPRLYRAALIGRLLELLLISDYLSDDYWIIWRRDRVGVSWCWLGDNTLESALWTPYEVDRPDKASRRVAGYKRRKTLRSGSPHVQLWTSSG
ncbi:jg24155, partial [Pararge aegeria aegeria]